MKKFAAFALVLAASITSACALPQAADCATIEAGLADGATTLADAAACEAAVDADANLASDAFTAAGACWTADQAKADACGAACTALVAEGAACAAAAGE